MKVPDIEKMMIYENAQAPVTPKDALQHALKPNPEAIFSGQ
jgi:hypothetical protein